MNEERNYNDFLVTEGAASRYLESENGILRLNDKAVPISERRNVSVYSRNNDIFPYYIKSYKYILFNRSRDKDSDAMLVHLDEDCFYETYFDVDQERDVLQTAKGNDQDAVYKNMGLWVIVYRIDTVVGVVEADN